VPPRACVDRGFSLKLLLDRLGDPGVPGHVPRVLAAQKVCRLKSLGIKTKVDPIQGPGCRFATGGVHGAMLPPEWLMSTERGRRPGLLPRFDVHIMPAAAEPDTGSTGKAGSGRVTLGPSAFFQPARVGKPACRAGYDVEAIRAAHRIGRRRASRARRRGLRQVPPTRGERLSRRLCFSRLPITVSAPKLLESQGAASVGR